MITSRMMITEGYVAYLREKRNACGGYGGTARRGHQEDLDVDGNILVLEN
jgi:hypothetical protein